MELKISGTNPKRKGRAPNIAKIRFDNGPASETHITAAGERRCKVIGLIGTGFAQPNPATINNKLPITSRWASGFNVSLPKRRGVSSPK